MMTAHRDAARKPGGKVTPGQHLTKLPGPRILIEDPGQFYATGSDGQSRLTSLFDAQALAERLQATVPTVAVSRRLSDFNLNEWDCIITTVPPVSLETIEQPKQYSSERPANLYSWSQRYPDHMSVVCVVSSGRLEVLDAFPPVGRDVPDLPATVIIRDPDTVGIHLRHVNGLPEGLASVVGNELVAVARHRQKHLSFRRWTPDGFEGEPDDVLPFRPFLLGPDDVVLAGTSERNSEASVWFLPDDVPDLFPWVVQALREWHVIYPDRFPRLPDWHGSQQWQSTAETAVTAERKALTTEFSARFEAYQQQLSILDAQSEVARARADAYQRALLTADGDLLSETVGCALAFLGFHVVDMDQHWPAGDRREDLRVFDDDDPAWVAILEVKGAKNGAKETEVQNFGRWVERFILDEHRAPDGRWFVTNHQRGTDPGAREAPFENKPAVLTTFAKSGGTVIDTRALFDFCLLYTS